MEADTQQDSKEAPELFFALVYPVGTDADRLVQTLSGELSEVGYKPRSLHLIDSLSSGSFADVYERYNQRMNRGSR